MNVMKEIEWLVTGYEPFLKKGMIRKVIGFYKKQPIIKDITGFPLRLNIKSHYKVIK